MYDINTCNAATQDAIKEFSVIVEIENLSTSEELEALFADMCVGEGIDTAACRFLLDMDCE